MREVEVGPGGRGNRKLGENLGWLCDVRVTVARMIMGGRNEEKRD